MLKKFRVILLLVSLCALTFWGALSLKATQETCLDMDCLGDGICGSGFKTFNGCTKVSICNGGSEVRCERPGGI